MSSKYRFSSNIFYKNVGSCDFRTSFRFGVRERITTHDRNFSLKRLKISKRHHARKTTTLDQLSAGFFRCWRELFGSFLIYRQSTKAINNLWRRCIILDCKGLSHLVCNPNAGIGLGCRNPLVPCGRGNLIFFWCPSQNLSSAVSKIPAGQYCALCRQS